MFLRLRLAFRVTRQRKESRSRHRAFVTVQAGQFYDRTTNFTEFKTIDACLDSGGREPQRGQGDCSTAAADDQADTASRTTDDAL